MINRANVVNFHRPDGNLDFMFCPVFRQHVLLPSFKCYICENPLKGMDDIAQNQAADDHTDGNGYQ